MIPRRRLLSREVRNVHRVGDRREALRLQTVPVNPVVNLLPHALVARGDIVVGTDVHNVDVCGVDEPLLEPVHLVGGEAARALDRALGDSVGAQAPAPAAREPVHRLRRGSRHKVDEGRVRHVDFLHRACSFFNICRDFSLGYEQTNGRKLGRRVTRLPPLHVPGAGREPSVRKRPRLWFVARLLGGWLFKRISRQLG